MPGKYYYLAAGLPEINLQAQPSIETDELLLLIKENMNEDDLKLFDYLLNVNDNKNAVLAIEKSLDRLQDYVDYERICSIPIERIERYSQLFDSFPKYMSLFFEENLDAIEGLSNSQIENRLLRYFYEEVINSEDDFISSYFKFELDMKNIVAAFNARKYDHDISSNLIQLGDAYPSLMKSNSQDFGLSEEYLYVPKILQAFGAEDVEMLENAVNEIIWNWLDEYNAFNQFSAYTVFAYFIKFGLVNRWYSLSEEEGKKRLEQIIMNIKQGYKIPAL